MATHRFKIVRKITHPESPVFVELSVSWPHVPTKDDVITGCGMRATVLCREFDATGGVVVRLENDNHYYKGPAEAIAKKCMELAGHGWRVQE